MDTSAWLDELEARTGERLAAARAPGALTVLYDPGCRLCQRCRSWMLGQASYVPLTFLACTGDEARRRFGDLPWLADELIVVGDGGEVWVGPAAFIVCLWALVDWRGWSFRLAAPAFAPLAERFFRLVSSQCRALAALLEHRCDDGRCRR